jgi:dTDP-4-dehydrorhamnose reductase
MKIAVLGAKGFVGSSIVGNLSNKHEVVPVSRETLNLLDTVKVVEFLKTNKFDVVVNAAATMADPN